MVVRSALGEYIHLHYKNYETYGTLRANDDKLTSLLDSSLITTYQEAINKRIYGNPKISPDAIKELKERLKQNSQKREKENEKRIQGDSDIYLEQINKLLYERCQRLTDVKNSQEAHEMIRTALGEFFKSTKTESELLAIYDKANQQYMKIIETINALNKKKVIEDREFENLQTMYKNYSHLNLKLDNSMNPRQQIEREIKRITYSGVASNIAGQFGQLLVATCDDTLTDKAYQSVVNAVEAGVKGGERSPILIDKDYLYKNIKGKIYRNSKKFDTNDTKYFLGLTQDKIDVQIKIKNENVRATVKTYNFEDYKAGRTELQQVNLLTTLAFLNSQENLINIGTHWLNLHVKHQGKNFSSDEDPRRGALDDIIKKEMAYQALAVGNPFKQNTPANVFIYINPQKGDIIVYPIAEILENIESIGGFRQISKIELANQKSNGDSDVRITKILNQARGKKFKAVFNFYTYLNP